MTTDGTERSGDLEQFAVECALNAASYTEFWIPGDPDYGFVDYFEAAAARNISLLNGFENLAEDAARRGILPQSDSDQARLVTDGGVTRPAVCVDTLDYDGAETHEDFIEGEVTRHYYICPNCEHPISTWMDCPECLWYDEDVWTRTLAERGESA